MLMSEEIQVVQPECSGNSAKYSPNIIRRINNFHEISNLGPYPAVCHNSQEKWHTRFMYVHPFILNPGCSTVIHVPETMPAPYHDMHYKIFFHVTDSKYKHVYKTPHRVNDYNLLLDIDKVDLSVRRCIRLHGRDDLLGHGKDTFTFPDKEALIRTTNAKGLWTYCTKAVCVNVSQGAEPVQEFSGLTRLLTDVGCMNLSVDKKED